MELLKISETYSVDDKTDSWNIHGTVDKQNNSIKINISISKLNSGEFLGNFAYTINTNNDITVSFDCDKTIDETLFNYGNNLVDQIVEQLSK